MLMGAAAAGAQTSEPARTTIERQTQVHDRLTITTRDGAQSKGQLIDAGVDALVLEAADGQRSFAYREIDRVQRHNNGIVLGVVVGAGAGLAAGLPLRARWNNEGGNGDRLLAACLVAGIGLGALLDALEGIDRTIYRRAPDSRAGFDLQPNHGGGSLRWSVRW